MKTLTDTITEEFKNHFSEPLKNIEKDKFLIETNLVDICRLYASDLSESRLTGSTIFMLDIASKLLWKFPEPKGFNRYISSFDINGIVYKIKEIFDTKKHSFHHVMANINDNSYGKNMKTLEPNHLEMVMPLFVQGRVLNIYTEYFRDAGFMRDKIGEIILTKPEKLNGFLDCFENQEILKLYKCNNWNYIDQIRQDYQQRLLWKASTSSEVKEALKYAQELKLEFENHFKNGWINKRD